LAVQLAAQHRAVVLVGHTQGHSRLFLSAKDRRALPDAAIRARQLQAHCTFQPLHHGDLAATYVIHQHVGRIALGEAVPVVVRHHHAHVGVRKLIARQRFDLRAGHA
jgi:hypothetical protein